MIATSKIRMDLTNRGVTPVVQAVQDDKYSRNLALRLYDGQRPWQIPDEVSAVCRYRKPDGTGGEYDTMPDGTAAWSMTGNTVTVKLAPQVLTAAGTVYFSVTLVAGDAELSSFAVKIEVSPLPGLCAASEDYYNRYDVVRSSGWTPNKYLATDAQGNLITVDAPEGSGGESGAGIDEVLDAIPRATEIALTMDGYTITVDTVLDDGTASTSVVALDDEGYPVSIVTDGEECRVSWQGFGEAALPLWEGGSY